MRIKITYLTREGKFFRTIAPIGMDELDTHMMRLYNISGIVAYSARPTTKKQYAKANNVEVKFTKKQAEKFHNS